MRKEERKRKERRNEGDGGGRKIRERLDRSMLKYFGPKGWF